MTTDTPITEAALADALRCATQRTGKLPPFDAVRSRSAAIGRRRRQRRGALAVTTVVLATVAVGLGVRFASGDDLRVATTTPVTTGAPTGVDLLVAAPSTGELSVWRDGARQRLVATGLGAITEVATTPDGHSAVVITEDPSAGCSSSSGPGLSRIRLDGGSPERLVGWAIDATISPDGQWVAYQYRCDGVGVGVTNLRDGVNFRLVAPEGSRPLAFTGPTTLLYAEPTADGADGSGLSTSESSFTDGGWQEGVPVDRHADPPVADPWVADASDSVFGLGSRLDSGREVDSTADPIHNFGRDGAAQVIAIATIRGDLHQLLVTTASADGSRKVWRVHLDDDLRLADIEQLSVPADVIAAAPLPR